MTVEDALRKIALLRRINTDNGSAAAEVETAYRLQKALMQRYAIKAQDIPDGSPTKSVFRLNWSYWQELLEEFGLSLGRLGNRGSAAVGNNSKVYIRLDKNQWWIEERSPRGWQATVRDRGLESLRKYLNEHAPRSYTFLRR
jgi:hypothetical protein